MKDNRNTKFSYFSDMSWFDGKGNPIPYSNHLGDNGNEKWLNDLPTRSSLNGIDTCENIIAMFGDSFMYGHGVRISETIARHITVKSKDTLAISFGVPGCGTQHTIKTVNQWLNTEYAEKTKAVVFNIAPLPRFDSIISSRYPQFNTPGLTGYWPDLYDETYENRCSVLQCNGGNRPESHLFDDSKIRKQVDGQYDSFFKFWDNPVNSLIQFENYMTHMYWICRGLDIPFYYVMNDWIISSFLNKNDLTWVREKLNELEQTSKLKRIDISELDTEYEEKQVYLPCGHWTPFSNKFIADKIYKEFLNDT